MSDVQKFIAHQCLKREEVQIKAKDKDREIRVIEDRNNIPRVDALWFREYLVDACTKPINNLSYVTDPANRFTFICLWDNEARFLAFHDKEEAQFYVTSVHEWYGYAKEYIRRYNKSMYTYDRAREFQKYFP